jgi:hypothetical protein
MKSSPTNRVAAGMFRRLDEPSIAKSSLAKKLSAEDAQRVPFRPPGAGRQDAVSRADRGRARSPCIVPRSLREDKRAEVVTDIEVYAFSAVLPAAATSCLRSTV